MKNERWGKIVVVGLVREEPLRFTYKLILPWEISPHFIKGFRSTMGIRLVIVYDSDNY